MLKPSIPTVLAILATTAAVGCVDERDYLDPGQMLESGWGTGTGAIRGDVGEIREIDSFANGLTFQSDPTWVTFSGNVPHQSSSSSVYVSVEIQNANRLQIGNELRQEGTGDLYSDDGAGDAAPQLSVYICPNGDGVSGNADEIVVRRIGRESFTFVAKSSIPEQNLDIDLGLGSDAESGIVQTEMARPADVVTE